LLGEVTEAKLDKVIQHYLDKHDPAESTAR